MIRSTSTPAIFPASLVAWRCESLKYAGTVITAFVTLSFSDLFNAIETENCLELVSEMIGTGELNAKIDEQFQMIAFEESEETMDLEELERACELLLSQQEAIKECEEEVLLDSRHIQKSIFLG